MGKTSLWRGYFTLRGVKLGVHEIDLLAVRHRPGQEPVCRHIKVQVSVRPVSYISRAPKAIQKQGRAANGAKRSEDELSEGVAEWVRKKFFRPEKIALLRSLWPGEWTRELVLHNVKADHEVDLIRANQARPIIRLTIHSSAGFVHYRLHGSLGAAAIHVRGGSADALG